MKQLHCLAETIASTYVRDLFRVNKNYNFSHNGKVGEVRIELLASGLVDNCLQAARMRGRLDYEREAYSMLMRMISLGGPEYQVTNHGLDVITTLCRAALSKDTAITKH